MDLDSTMRMTDRCAVTREGILFNAQQGVRSNTDSFQLKLEELEEELKMSDSLLGLVRLTVAE